MTWNTPRSTITSTRFGASLDLRTLSTWNVIESPASFAAAFAFLIALPEISVATTSKPRFARLIACVAGPVPRSRRCPPRRRCAFRARSMSGSRSGLYHGRVATSEVAYSFSQSPVGPVAPGGSTLPRPARRRAEHALVVAQAELRLCDADGQAVQPGVPETSEVLQGRGIVLHVGRAVDRRRDLRDLLLEKILVLVDEPHRLRSTGRRIEDEPRQPLPACSALLMAGVRGRPHAEVLAMVHDGIDLAVRVGDEPIHPDHGREAERLQDSYVRIEVHHAVREGLRILHAQLLPLRAAVVLQRADADDEDRSVGSEPALAAHQIHELLRAEVRSEADLCDDDIPDADPEAVREDRVVTVRDVRERPTVPERRSSLERLHQVRHERVLQQDRRGTVHVEVSDLHRTLLAVERDDDSFEARLEVRDPFRQTEDRHHLARGRDHELVLPRDPMLRAAETRDDVAQLSVVHVEAPRE